MRRSALLGVVLVALATTTAAAPAAPTPGPRPLAPLPPPGALPASPFGAPIRDRVIRLATAAALPRRAIARGRYYRTKDGTRIFAVLSPGYRYRRTAVQSFVNFFGRLPHRSELRLLRLVIETPEEISVDCSTDALACYTTPGNVLRIPGQQQAGQPPLPYVLAHEYGHHVAYHRSNAPFPSVLFGPKQWASRERVCPGFAAHKLFPGDEGRHYYANPGEAWAESYAQNFYAEHKVFNLPWQFSPLLKPDAASFRAVRADVRHAWHHVHGRSFQIRGRSARRTVSTPLDGLATVRVRAPRGTLVRTRLVSRGRNLPRVRGLEGSLVCGPRSVQLRVVRIRGRGPVKVTVLRP